MKVKLFCFFVFSMVFGSAIASDSMPVFSVLSTLMYLEKDTPSETYNLVLGAQQAWMDSTRKDCDAQTSEIGSSSARNEQYENCMLLRFSGRKKYLSQFLCGAGVTSGEECSKEGDLEGYIKVGGDAMVFSKQIRDFIFSGGKLDRVRSVSLIDVFVANEFVSNGYISQDSVPMFNDIGYALSESGSLEAGYIILSGVESKAPERLVLKLNLADTLWGLNQKDKAKTYYKSYMSAMAAAGKSKAVPSRVEQRVADK